MGPTSTYSVALPDAYGLDEAMYFDTIGLADPNGDTIAGPALADADGWDQEPYHATMRWADVDGDGADDLCARGLDAVYCWRSLGAGFDGELAGPAWGDAQGWGTLSAYDTVVFAGGRVVEGDGDSGGAAAHDSAALDLRPPGSLALSPDGCGCATGGGAAGGGAAGGIARVALGALVALGRRPSTPPRYQQPVSTSQRSRTWRL